MIDNEVEITQCFTCDLVANFFKLGSSFAENVFDGVTGIAFPFFNILASISLLFFVVKLLYGSFQIKQLSVEFAALIISFFALNKSGKPIIIDIFYAMLDVAGLISLTIVDQDITNQSIMIYDNVFMSLVHAVEDSIFEVFDVAGTIIRSTGWLDYIPLFFGLLMVLPYFLILVSYVSQVFVLYLRLTIILSLAPLLFLAYAFRWGRGPAMQAWAAAVASIFVFIATNVVLGLILFFVSKLDLGALLQAESPSDLILSGPFIAVFVMGWLGTAGIMQSTEMANSITGAKLGNGAVGIMTAGIGGSAAWLGKRALSGTGKGLGTATNLTSKALGQDGAGEKSVAENLGYAVAAGASGVGGVAMGIGRGARNLIGI